ncbi:MAG: nuclear transport factor 2 family protein [Vulcanimicrobiota bacterium]
MTNDSTWLIHEWFRRVWQEGDLDAIEELMHPENLSLGLVNDPVGLESFKAVFRTFSEILSDVRVTIEKTYQEGDGIAGRWLLCGTHRATGRSVAWPGALFARVKDDKFLECTNYLDYLDFFVQIGALPGDTWERCLDQKHQGFYGATLGKATISDLQRIWDAEESRFAVLFETSAAAMALVDRQDRIVEINRAFDYQFGGDSELIGRSFHELIHESDGHEEAELFADLCRGKLDQFQLELRMTRGQAVVWVQLSTAGPQATPQGDRILRAVQDITTRRLEKMVRFQEQERRMLAADLHDALAQELATLVVQLQLATTLQDKNPQDAREALQQALTLGQRMGKELSGMIRSLRSPVGEGVQLATALEDLARAASSDSCRVKCQLALSTPVTAGLTSLFAYRIVQEAVQNAQRHGRATEVRVAISALDGRLKGRVEDDGSGFEYQELPGHGIAGMRERCELVGGRFWLESSPGQGTSIRFELPLPKR